MKIVGKIADIIQELMQLNTNEVYFVEIKQQKSHRTLNQNKLLWKLVHKIAKNQCQDDMDIYCTLLERADAKSDYILAIPGMEDDLRRVFRGVKFIRQQELGKKTFNIYKVYLGSSKMTVREMNELLNIAIQLCSELDIPTERMQ